MAIDFDPAKNEANLAKHGLSLADFDGFDSSPLVIIDGRRDYGETRYLAFGRIDGEGRCLAFTVREGRIRAISLRRAREKEMRLHGR